MQADDDIKPLTAAEVELRMQKWLKDFNKHLNGVMKYTGQEFAKVILDDLSTTVDAARAEQILMSFRRFHKKFHEEKVSPFFGLPKSKSTEPLVGWRTWKFTEEYILKSVFANVEWEGPVMTTMVQPNGHLTDVCLHNKAKYDASGRGDYGIYSYKTLAGLGIHHGIDDIFGKVDNLGQVIEHELGYRAQKCIIQELWLISWTFLEHDIKSIVYTLEQRYGCKVNVIDKYENYLQFLEGVS